MTEEKNNCHPTVTHSYLSPFVLEIFFELSAKMAGMSRVTLGRYEAGQRTLTVDAVSGIAKALEIPVEKLIYPDMWQENEMPTLPDEYDDISLANLSNALDRRSHKIADFIECLDKLNEKGQDQFIKRMRQVFEDMQHNPAYRRKRQSGRNIK